VDEDEEEDIEEEEDVADDEQTTNNLKWSKKIINTNKRNFMKICNTCISIIDISNHFCSKDETKAAEKHLKGE
jgi:hypothetical protein